MYEDIFNSHGLKKKTLPIPYDDAINNNWYPFCGHFKLQTSNLK
jgi:hypothetical protein